MKAPKNLSDKGLDELLRLLDPDGERRGEGYEKTRRKLLKFFEWRGCPAPEECCDDTLDRVAKQLEAGREIRNATAFILGVARNVLREAYRKPKTEPLPPNHPTVDPVAEEERSPRLECLETCLATLAPKDADLLMEYYDGQMSVPGKAKAQRKTLAAAQGDSPNALRIKVFRLKQALADCVTDCVSGQRGASVEIETSLSH